MESNQTRYAARGASASKEEVHAAIAQVDKGLYPNAFCKILPDLAGADAAFCNLMHADGAGTKSALAWAYWRETGDLSVWRGIAQDAVVMNTDDLLCVGCQGPMLLSSTIGRNKRLVPGEVIKAIIDGTEQVLAMLRSYGIDITACGGETADLGDLVRTVVVDSTVYARMPRRDVIDNGNLRPGLAIVGLASYGQATYEEGYNAGMGSNGLTSARHELLGPGMLPTYADTVEPGMPTELAYAGPYRMTDAFPGIPGMDVGKAILSPTRTYTPVVLAMIEASKKHILGMVHCSGGGQTKVLHFLPEGVGVVKDTLLPLPPLFAEIKRVSGTSWREMAQVYNLGHRMEVYAQPDAVPELLACAARFDIQAQVVGHTHAIKSGEPRLAIWLGGGVEYYN